MNENQRISDPAKPLDQAGQTTGMEGTSMAPSEGIGQGAHGDVSGDSRGTYSGNEWNGQDAGVGMSDIIKIAREVYGDHTKWEGETLARLERLVELARSAEREALAKHFDAQPSREMFGGTVAEEIRARGQS